MTTTKELATPTRDGLRANELAERYGISRSALYSAVARGDFPAPRKIGKCSVWLVSDLNAHFEREGS